MLRPYVEKAFAAKGSVMLGEYIYPVQVVWGRKKLSSLDDIKGLKLRVASPEQGEFVRRFGGTSITMGAPEVPSALDRGVVDGIFTAGVGAVLWKDLLKYGYLISVNVNNSYVIANAEAYRKLTPAVQGQLREAVVAGARWNQDAMKQEEGEAVQTLTAANYVITRATQDELAKASATMKPYWTEWAKTRGPDVEDRARQGTSRARPVAMGEAAGQRKSSAALAKQAIAETRVELFCKGLCVAALIVMLVVIGTDILTRSLLNFSFEISDELGGYMLVLISFVSLSVCQVNDSFHHVEFVQARLSERGRVISRLIFDGLSLGFALLLAWQLVRFELSSWRSGDQAPTYLATPLWLPRIVLVIGAAALCVSVARTLIGHARKLRRLTGIQPHGS